jgi:aminoglycoside phosphotransferase (APT) family kinase protein
MTAANTQTQADTLLSAADLARLCEWMDLEGLPAGTIEDLRPLPGGTQNIMLSFSRGGLRCVLRRPPRNKRAHSDRTMLREARILEGLAGTAVPHARLIACCQDPQVLGAVFYLMEPIEGFNATNGLPPRYRDDEQLRHRMGFGMIEALVTLGEVDYRRQGLADLGQPEGFLQRQAQRWQSELEGYLRLPGYDRIALPDLRPIAQYLQDRLPSTTTPGLMHGDYHLANVMFAPDSARVAAIVDWEMCTLGDPLLDLAWLLESWPQPGVPRLFNFAPAETMGSIETLIEHYAARGTRSLGYLDWYRVLACYKYGILLEGTHARARAGKASQAIGDRLHEIAVELIERALRKIRS